MPNFEPYPFITYYTIQNGDVFDLQNQPFDGVIYLLDFTAILRDHDKYFSQYLRGSKPEIRQIPKKKGAGLLDVHHMEDTSAHRVMPTSIAYFIYLPIYCSKGVRANHRSGVKRFSIRLYLHM